MTFALQVLIASGIFCAVIIALLLVQQRGYLKHPFFTISILLASMLFLIAASAFFYYEYSGYQGLEKRHQNASKANQKLDGHQFNHLEIDVLEEFHEAKNTLIGYERFLEQSAQNYNPDNFSYENLLKEKLIAEFERKEYVLAYWNDISQTVTGVYENNALYHWDKFPMAIVPNDEHEEIEFEKGTEHEHIEFYSNLTYIQRKIKSFDRSPEGIEDLWSKNKVFIYTILTKANYNKISKTVNDLITVHDRITQEPDHRKFYAHHNLWTEDGYYNEVFLTYPSKEIVSSYNNNWLFGFWDRRFEENNDEMVLTILKEVQSHYKD